MIHVLKDHWSGPYVEYDDQTDVMLATYGRKGEALPSLWKTLDAAEPDLDVGYYITHERVCVDAWCDEWEDVALERYTWLRLRNAKTHGNWGADKALWLAIGCGLGFGLVTTIRHGQLALMGEHWWETHPKG